MPKLTLNNLRLGQRADGGNTEDALEGLRRLVNYDLQYGGETVDLRVRPGYGRYNAIALPAAASQVRTFVDNQENQHILAISDGKWYDVSEAGAHNQVSAFDAISPKTYLQWGNRAILGTEATDSDDPGLVWTTHDELAGAPRSYRVGIMRPEEPPGIQARAKDGHTHNPTHIAVMNDTDQKKLAIEYTPPFNITVRDVYVKVRRFEQRQDLTGSWQMKIYTDNAGEPSSTMVDDDAVSSWMPVANFQFGVWTAYKLFKLRDAIKLTGAVKYFLVFEGDTAYYDHYLRNALPTDFYGVIGLEGLPPSHYGPAQGWDGAAWDPFDREAVFYIGGMEGDNLVTGAAYEYVYTYYNETYQSESRPSDGARFKPGADEGAYISGLVVSPDPQVDKMRVYRRELDTMDVAESLITDTYKFVVELDPGEITTDAAATAQLGAELQTMDHYPLDDFSAEEEEGIRTAPIIPTCACMWKGRIWVGEETNNKLAYTKVFEENGRTGMLGLSAIDYFPLDNVMEVPEPAHPISLYPVSNDQLVIHMSNDKTYLVYGGDQALNPPADFSIRPYLHSNASFGVGCGTLWGTYHVFLSRAGLYMVSGFGSLKPQYLSEENQSILDTVTNVNLDDSVVLAVGNEIWTLIDFDNDGDLDTILIVDMQKDVPAEHHYDRPWKMYQYDTGLADLAVITSGDDFQQVYAADVNSGYILELRKGDTDNGTGITAYWDSHDLIYPNQAMIYQIDIDAWYPDASAIPDYTWLLTDSQGNTASGVMDNILSSEDVRGHRSGCRLKGGISVRGRVSQLALKQNVVRGFSISHTGE